jgi:NAD(P)-dependent dehydrogenase (short-subunit alcohol dehydrogenase family)
MGGEFWDSDAGAKLVASLPRRRLGEPRDLDALLLLLCADEASRFINGSAITVDDGMTSW